MKKICDCDIKKKEFCDICLQQSLNKAVNDGLLVRIWKDGEFQYQNSNTYVPEKADTTTAGTSHGISSYD